MGNQTQQQVHRRRVFYIPGYDPVPPRRYRELYRTESQKQAKLSGYSIELKEKPGRDLFGWRVIGRIEGATTYTQIDVLLWSDLVRESMSNSIPATYLQLLRTAWIYVVSGTLRRLMWLRKGPVIAALYPVGMLLLQLVLAILSGILAAFVLRAGVGLFWHGDAATSVTAVASMVLGAGVIVVVLQRFRALDGRLYAYYLMHDYAYTARLNGQNPPELEARISRFADQIAHALTQDVDEVLIVGHSSGAHIGVSVMADLIRAGRVPANGPALSFLSLGQVVPMVSFLKRAHRLRADLRYLSACDDLCWVDVSAPGDGCSFALCDPVAVTGVAPPDKKWPLVISAAFSQTLSRDRWAELRWRFFRLHFQYLCAFDRPGDYDYFRITAGPWTLASRYADRKPSRSRIDVAASKYTSVSE
ncbi:hypothetical protein I5535_13910 [Rhodobacteraceae bacterium F11138]|nr:hypothetical protein [Rhodobacteraceae bacterium F11138]